MTPDLENRTQQNEEEIKKIRQDFKDLILISECIVIHVDALMEEQENKVFKMIRNIKNTLTSSLEKLKRLPF